MVVPISITHSPFRYEDLLRTRETTLSRPMTEEAPDRRALPVSLRCKHPEALRSFAALVLHGHEGSLNFVEAL